MIIAMRINRHLIFSLFLVAAMLAACGACCGGSFPTIQSYPQVTISPVIANNSTSYIISTTISDNDGYNDIIDVRVMINYCEADGDQTKARGYMAWGTTDSEITRYGGAWTLAAAIGEGRWGYTTDIWGGVTYISPRGCITSVSGSASGATGSRTVSWSFRAMPAFARNPLINDADVWACDSINQTTGWQENPGGEFDVVSATCSHFSVTPKAPVVTNPTGSTLDVAINPLDSDIDLYCIRILPASSPAKQFVQADGTLGGLSVFQSKSVWGTKKVTGLASDTAYSFKVRANRPDSGWCPSGWSVPTGGSTTILTRTIDTAVAGQQMYRGVIGSATRLDFGTQAKAKTWDILYDTCARGLAGGLDADTYNWKDMGGQGVGHTGTPGAEVTTTLEWMQLIRNHRSTPMVTANVRGIGPVSSSGYGRFYYTDTTLATVKQLAADWVRYTNCILPTYRQGDTLPPTDQAILDSINWYGKPKLLAPGEAATPKVTYWEIGNEPELPLPWSTPGATQFGLDGPGYAARYKEMAVAMLAADPSIKLGPCVLAPNPTLATLDAVLTDHTLPVDFISYHPYGPLRWFASQYGDTASSAEAALRYVKPQLQAVQSNVIASINRCGRNPANIQIIASEYNPSSWEWECSTQISRVSQALGIAETFFTFTEQGMFAANFWSWCHDGTETPAYKVFKMAKQHWGEKLIDSFSDGLNLRMYTAWNPQSQDLCIWAINMSQDYDKPVQISLSGLGVVGTITQKRLQKITGTTSLLDTNDPPPTTPSAVDWVTTDLTGAITPSSFNVTFPRATITLLVFHRAISLSSVRSRANGDLVGVASAQVSGVFKDVFYIQSDDRCSGIRVYMPGHSVTEGSRVSVSGTIETTADGERQIVANAVTTVGGL